MNGQLRGLAAHVQERDPQPSRPRSSRSAARPPASAVRSATRCPAATYVYQAMRVTGAGDPTRTAVLRPSKGKLPQRKIVTRPLPRATPPTATRSALPPAIVHEIIPPGLCGKAHGDRRGSRCSSAGERHPRGTRAGRYRHPARRHAPAATAAAVQPAPPRRTPRSPSRPAAQRCRRAIRRTERKIQRLFRDRQVSPALIRRCNDFGAGGVSVAIGELADGLDIDLDKRPEEVRQAWTAPSWPSPSRRSAWLSLSAQRTSTPSLPLLPRRISRLLL